VFKSPAGATFASVGGTAAFVLVSAGASAGVSPTVCKTDTLPCKAGIEIINADSIKTVAATIVIFANTEAVPRGPNAVFEMLLVNSAPASVLPGCKSTDPIRMTHETKNNVYKTYSNLLTHPFGAPSLRGRLPAKAETPSLFIIHDLCEAFRFQACSADQRAIDIFLGHQRRDIVRLYRTAVQNAHRTGCIAAMSFR